MLNFDLTLQRGDFQLHMAATLNEPVTAIFGASGAGKSTLLALLAGLLAPTQGRIVLADRVLVDTRQRVFVPPHQRHIGLLFQDGRLFPHLDVRQNLLYGWQRLRPAQRRYALDDIVAMLDIGSLLARMPQQLSGGERQRVALGRALLYSPQLLLLDEPLSALDSRLKAQILPFLQRVRDETGIPMLYVSHSRDEIAALTPHVLTLADGRLVDP
ncbi:MAG: molybdenum ABC transporter ATP-binding protein [Pseudomonadota bacterium]